MDAKCETLSIHNHFVFNKLENPKQSLLPIYNNMKVLRLFLNQILKPCQPVKN